MSVYLVRHAKAGDRRRWSAPDELRPLDEDGRRQADGLVELLRGEGIERVVSSPYLRCTQTVEPLAALLDLPVETDHALGEGGGYEEVLALFRQAGVGRAVLCTHGDIVEMTLDRLVQSGVPIDGPLKLKKGSTWVIELDEAGAYSGARYLPPP